MDPSTLDEKTLKGGGFIKLRQPGRWAVRVRLNIGDTDVAGLRALADIAEKFGDGEIHMTVRQAVEIRGVRLEDFEAIRGALEAAGLGTGGCGPRVRVPVACPGAATCKRGLADTRPLAEGLQERLYGREGIPHKFKAAVTGCNASCAKAQGNDIGFMGALEPVFDEADGDCIACGICADACPTGAITLDSEGRPVINLALCERDGECVNACPTGAIRARATGWRVFLGGNFGRRPILGKEIASFVSTEEALDIAERAVDAFARHDAGRRERLRVVADRVGFDEFAKEVLG